MNSITFVCRIDEGMNNNNNNVATANTSIYHQSDNVEHETTILSIYVTFFYSLSFFLNYIMIASLCAYKLE
jgi:hypothetical protein